MHNQKTSMMIDMILSVSMPFDSGPFRMEEALSHEFIQPFISDFDFLSKSR